MMKIARRFNKRQLFRFVVALAVPLSLLPCVSSASAHVPGAHSMDIKVPKTVGNYSLVLMIGPAEVMGNSEIVVGPMVMPNCYMPGDKMKMGKKCNHHVELHVYHAHTTNVITNAHVTITLFEVHTHTTIHVPIMKMKGRIGGMKDFHYGNNVYAAPGTYSVITTVNTTRATFAVTLR